MFPAASLLTTLLLALSIAATPVEVRSPRVTLPFAKRINTSGGAIQLVEHDQARATALKERGAAIQSGNLDRRTASFAVTNEAVSYVAAVQVGNPATTCVLRLCIEFHDIYSHVCRQFDRRHWLFQHLGWCLYTIHSNKYQHEHWTACGKIDQFFSIAKGTFTFSRSRSRTALALSLVSPMTSFTGRNRELIMFL